MKKIIVIIVSIFSLLNSMEPETPPCFFNNMPVEIQDLIASFLTFDDIESEEEFINRTKNFSTYHKLPASIEEEPLNSEQMQLSFLKKHVNITDLEGSYAIDSCVYNLNKTICAITYESNKRLYKLYQLSIINIEKDQLLYNNDHSPNQSGLWTPFLTTPFNENLFASIYFKHIDKEVGPNYYIFIKNIRTQTDECYPHNNDLSNAEIAFNKQGTLLIIRTNNENPITLKNIPFHTIIPLTKTLESTVLPTKTLCHYFAQKFVCKDLKLQ